MTAAAAMAEALQRPSIELIEIKDSNEPFKLNCNIVRRRPVSVLRRKTRNACSPSGDHAPTAA
jgi:hypothetical protein